GWSLLSAGKAPVLEPVATSFRSWAQYLSQRALQPSVLGELEYWQRVLTGGELLPGARVDASRDCIATSGSLRFTLPVEITEALLTAVPAAFYAQINDVLLTALALAALQWRRDHTSVTGPSIVIDLEG